ncbi:MAG: DNA-binding protein Fis [Syntrophaceae bacterium PtaU1.Bin231]|nr:MAG: DNA-binding protein Fis [Syntrophaceae bacterium PtaU1.Bin231]HOG16422.1 helix-turn-helix domain-containing protein [Syntrophales bacterium]
MNRKRPSLKVSTEDTHSSPLQVVEEVMEKKLEEVATVLFSTKGGKSRLYEDVVSLVERSLFRIALRNSKNVKSTAAAYLGINRNTFQSKMIKLGLNGDKE